MDSSLVLEFGREALITALVICGPVLAIGLIVGLVWDEIEEPGGLRLGARIR